MLNIEWTQYATREDQKSRRNGRKRRGENWSAAPGRMRRWVLPEDAAHRGFGNMIMVTVTPDPKDNYSLDEWGPG